MPSPPYTYEKSGRRPMTWAALAFVCLLMVIAWIYSAPWDIWALWILALFGLGLLLARNPKYGIRLDPDKLTYWVRGPEREIALADIDHVEFRGITDSSYVTIHKRDGEIVRIFADAFPPAAQAIAALNQRGVRTKSE